MENFNTQKGKFINRENELEILFNAFDQVKENKGQTILIKGMAGIGKTRFILEFAERIKKKDEEIKFISGVCRTKEDHTPYLPFKEILQDIIQEIEKDKKNKNKWKKLKSIFVSAGEILATFIPALQISLAAIKITKSAKDLIKGKKDDEASKINKIFTQEDVFGKIFEILITLAEKNPLILMIDDMQWADKASIDLFNYIARKIDQKKLMLIGTYRPEDIEFIEDKEVHYLEQIIIQIKRDSLFTEIKLDTLNYKDCSELIDSFFDIIKKTSKEIIGLEELKRVIYNKTEGEPFFTIELLHCLQDLGRIKWNDEVKKWEINIEEDLVLPEKVQDILSLRIKNLKRRYCDILDICAIIGNEFSSKLVNCGLDNINYLDLLKYLRDLCRVYFLETKGRDYKFFHNKIHTYIIDNLRAFPELFENYHLIVGKCLEESYEKSKKENQELIYDIANHYNFTQKTEKLLEYSEQAGMLARKAWAFDISLRFFNMALNASKKLNRKKKEIDILRQLGVINWILGKWDQSLQYYEAAKEIIDNNDIIYITPDHDVSPLVGIGLIYGSRDDIKREMEYYEESLEYCKKHNDQQGIAITLNNMGRVYYQKEEYETAKKNHEEAGAIFLTLNDLAGYASALNNEGNAMRELNELNEALKKYNEARGITEKINYKKLNSKVLLNIGVTQLKSNNLEDGKSNIFNSLGISNKIGYKKGQMRGYRRLGEYYLISDNLNMAATNKEKEIEVLAELKNYKKINGVLMELQKIYRKMNYQEKLNEIQERIEKNQQKIQRSNEK